MKNTIEQAKSQIKGFKELSYLLEHDIIINGKSQKTYISYIRQIANLSLFFNKYPLDITIEQIADYLFMLKTENYSETSFKFTVYGMRYIYRLYNLEDKLIKLPSIPHKKELPVVLSQNECKELFKSAETFKDKFLLCLIYSAGLRSEEVQKLQKSDIDTDRMTLLVRKGKGGKSRYVVLSKFIARKFQKYCDEYKIWNYLFPGQKPGNYISKSSIFKILKTALSNSSIEKNVNLHSLRHSFATHMLENGIDIMTVKEQLGHSDIRTTMKYLHVARLSRKTAVSPLDFLYNIS